MPKSKHYAVAVGREGPKIYESWEECKAQISRWPGAKHRSFTTMERAREWLGVHARVLPPKNAPIRLDYDSVPLNESMQYEPAVAKSNSARNLVIPPLSTATLRPSGKRLPNVSHASDSYLRGNSCQVADDLEVCSMILSDEAGNLNSHKVPLPVRPLSSNRKPLVPSEHASALAPGAIVLSPEQQEVLDIVRAGGNVFFTGSAGTGKSVLLREIIKLKGGRASHRLGITAATGIAAVNIGGTTLHSWGGIGLGQETASKLIGKILHQPKCEQVKKRWIDVETLIIDEISMIDGSLFDKLEDIARGLRRSQRPFGGIQLVLSGDFCQLPPVSQRDEKGATIPAKFAFDADSWESCVGKPVTLKRVFRQKDQAFVEILNAMRFGRLSEDAKDVFRRLSRKVKYDDGIEPTELFSTRKEVDSANRTRLQQLPGTIYTYEAIDSSGWDSNGKKIGLDQAEKSLERLVAPKVMRLKAGAQVMLVKNIVQGVLVNGTVGKITKFLGIKEAFEAGIEVARSDSSDSNNFGSTSHNQLDTLRRDNLPSDGASNLTNGNSRQLITALYLTGVWPVVDFLVPSTSVSGGKRTVLCVPNDFTVNNAEGGMEAKREQVPIILAWALSVHKSQGQTLDRVKVDLTKTFEKGQAYVALSRATTMDHLQITNFHESKVMAHPRVLDWHRQVYPEDPQLQDPSQRTALRESFKKAQKKNLADEMEIDEWIS